MTNQAVLYGYTPLGAPCVAHANTNHTASAAARSSCSPERGVGIPALGRNPHLERLQPTPAAGRGGAATHRRGRGSGAEPGIQGGIVGKWGDEAMPDRRNFTTVAQRKDKARLTRACPSLLCASVPLW